MINKQKLKCLFGHHYYTIPHKVYLGILVCEGCQRFGHRQMNNGYLLYKFDVNGIIIPIDDSKPWWGCRFIDE